MRRDKATEELRKQVAEIIQRENRYPRTSAELLVVFAHDQAVEHQAAEPNAKAEGVAAKNPAPSESTVSAPSVSIAETPPTGADGKRP